MIVWKFVDNSKVIWCHTVCFGFCKQRDFKHDAVEKLFDTLLCGPVIKDAVCLIIFAGILYSYLKKHKFGQVNPSLKFHDRQNTIITSSPERRASVFV